MEKQSIRFRGPSLLLLGLAHVVLFVANMVAARMLHHGGPGYVNPYADGESIRVYLAAAPEATRVSNFLIYASALPLGIFAVTVVSRLRYLGVRAAGTGIAMLGGLLAAMMLIFSGFFGYVLSLPEVYSSVAVARAGMYLCFLCGGTGFAAGFGLLAAGVSVTAAFQRLLPRWLIVVGLVVAGAGELSTLSLLVYQANFLIPVTRMLGFVWLLGVAILLPSAGKTRSE